MSDAIGASNQGLIRRAIYDHGLMKNALTIFFAHLCVTLAKLWGPGGTRTVLAENLLLKQQLLLQGEVDGATFIRLFAMAIADAGVHAYLSSDPHPVFTSHHCKA